MVPRASSWLPALLLAACASTDRPPQPATIETDGARVRRFAVDRDTAYHAAIDALTGLDYAIEMANPLAGQIVAQSPVRRSHVPLFGDTLRYTIARVDLESPPGGGTRVRLQLTATREPEGAGRRPNNDRPVRDDDEYDAVFGALAAAAGA